MIKKQKKNILELDFFTAEHMNCFLQVSVFCLEGLISEFDLDVWIYHLKADSIISKETITPTNLKDIKKFTMLWREGFKMCFTNDELSKTTTKESEVSDYSDDDDDEAEQKKKQKKKKKKGKNWKSLMIACIEQFRWTMI